MGAMKEKRTTIHLMMRSMINMGIGMRRRSGVKNSILTVVKTVDYPDSDICASC